ncbi:MAG: hypothetical protein QOE35_4006 [Actinomycetota bacterium]|jgi:hypothetical protein
MRRFIAAAALIAALTPLGVGRAGAAVPVVSTGSAKRADHITCVVVNQINTTWCLDRLPLPTWPLW